MDVVDQQAEAVRGKRAEFLRKASEYEALDDERLEGEPGDGDQQRGNRAPKGNVEAVLGRTRMKFAYAAADQSFRARLSEDISEGRKPDYGDDEKCRRHLLLFVMAPRPSRDRLPRLLTICRRAPGRPAIA